MISSVTKIYDTLLSNQVSYEITWSDNTKTVVPHDTANSDYQAIQEWIADGNSVVDPNAEQDIRLKGGKTWQHN